MKSNPLIEALGGEKGIEAIVTDFYQKVFSDIMIGFFFKGRDRARLIQKEFELALDSLGEVGRYTGRNLGQTHSPLKITGGQFDRRMVLLKEAIDRARTEHPKFEDAKQAWLTHAASLRNVITAQAKGECKFSNRLANEKSPYLLQHAHNPVDWYPWGEEAFQKARSENKPIFLSIGYATCHWCHVMEKESFEDVETAKILNDHFVSVKVDREERPDVDEIYMATLTQVFGVGGGWPLSMWLTPELKPFYGGTYFPPQPSHGRPSFKGLLNGIARGWKEKRADVESDASKITDHLQKLEYSLQGESLSESTLKNAFEMHHRSYDPVNGGLGHAPKFPQVSNLLFLTRYYSRTKDARALAVVEKQLVSMANGGIFDHLGGGFARYSTDEAWHVPHFEKMLYDQAQCLKIYAEAFQITQNPFYKEVCQNIVHYTQTDLRTSDGTYCTAEDADSEGVEGKFYVWKKSEIDNILTSDEAKLFCETFDVSESGNWQDPHFDTAGLNVLRKVRDISLTDQALLEGAKTKLLKVREKRTRPIKDDKILTSWNALMAASLAYAGKVCDIPTWVSHAQSVVRALETKHVKSGRLYHRYKEGDLKGEALLEDLAYLVWAYVELYEATLDTQYLLNAKKWAEQASEHYFDATKGGFYSVEAQPKDLITRFKNADDGALPSPSNLMIWMMVRLNHYFEGAFSEKTKQTLEAMSGVLSKVGVSVPIALVALDYQLGPQTECVIRSETPDFLKAALQQMVKAFLPRTALANAQNESIAFSQQKGDGKNTIYWCQNSVCELPMTSIDDFKRKIEDNR